MKPISINEILKGKQISFVQGPVNEKYERAKILAEYIGVSTPFVLKLIRDYGIQRVENLKSWVKDVKFDSKKGLPGLIVWKLKQK